MHEYVSRRSGNKQLINYSDLDHADDLDTRKSTFRVLFFLCDNPID